MEKLVNGERTKALEDLSTKQSLVIELLTDIGDKYKDFKETEFLKANLKNASDQIHKIILFIASGNSEVEKEI